MGQISSIGGADSASVHDFALDSQHAATKTDVNALRLDVTSEIGALRAETLPSGPRYAASDRRWNCRPPRAGSTPPAPSARPSDGSDPGSCS